MSTGWGLYLRARASRTALLLTIVDLVIVLAARDTVFEIRLVDSQLPRFTPIWEALPVLLAILLPGLISPRLASWETLGHSRLWYRATALGILAVTAPAIIPWLAHLRLPADARWWDISCNVVAYGAVALTATALLGVRTGSTLGLVTYLAVIVVQQVSPTIAAYLPVSGAKTNLTPHPTASLVLACVAVSIWGSTLGQARPARDRRRND